MAITVARRALAEDEMDQVARPRPDCGLDSEFLRRRWATE
jgi:hypothetical protein